ncbi:MAG: hypothetical protein AABZ12_03295 [Planctomycetota bacterium]
MLCSPLRLAANRRNAQRSTGPRTPEGKSRSSRNAVKHNILARDVVIRDGDGAENPSDFNALLRELDAQFKPVGPVERALVERIAAAYWRLRRVHRFEVGLLRRSLDESRRAHDPQGDADLAKIDRRLAKVRDSLAQDEQHAGYFKQFDLTNPATTTDKLRPLLLEDALYLCLDAKNLDMPALRDLVLAGLAQAAEQHRSEITRLEAERDEAERYQAVRLSRRALVGDAPIADDLFKLARYESILDRQIHQALAEFRRRGK